jgi:D-sedoheptulose 7-phosphate isomerase
LGRLTTEKSCKDSPRTAEAGEIAEFVERYQHALGELDQNVVLGILECLMDVWRQGGTVYAMGNGGSASTASHFAADLAKYTIVAGKKRFKVLGLTDNVPLVSSWTNDGGFNRPRSSSAAILTCP